MKNVLVIKTSSLGDICHVIPAVQSLRKMPEVQRVDWLANEEYCDFLKHFGPCDQAIPFPRTKLRLKNLIQQPASSFASISRFLRELRRRHYDLVIDFQGLFRSGALAALSRHDRVVGLKHRREGKFFYTQAIPVKAPHAVAEAFELIGRPLPSKTDLNPELITAETAPSIVFLPETRWASKTWPDSYWLQLCALVEHQCAIERLGFRSGTVLGISKSKELGEKIEQQSSGFWTSTVGKTSLVDAAHACLDAGLVVGSDSGLTHFTALHNKPTLGIFGPSRISRTGLLGAHTINMVATNVDCLGCRKRQCPKPRHLCMQHITPAKVLNTIMRHVG